MDKIFSTRLDESVVADIERMSRRMGITKKRFLEDAIRHRLGQLTAKDAGDVWSETCGTWKSRESPAQTVKKARAMFQKSFERRHRAE